MEEAMNDDPRPYDSVCADRRDQMERPVGRTYDVPQRQRVGDASPKVAVSSPALADRAGRSTSPPNDPIHPHQPADGAPKSKTNSDAG
jgi:hypothetical protein